MAIGTISTRSRNNNIIKGLIILAFLLLILLIPTVLLSSLSAVASPAAPSLASIKDQQYSPPRDNLELSLKCATQALELGTRLNALISPDQQCNKSIGQVCMPALLTLEECYAHFFVIPDVVPEGVASSITAKLNAMEEQEQQQQQQQQQQDQ